MTSYLTKISLFISLLLFSCSSTKKEQESEDLQLSYSKLTYGLKIDASPEETIKNLEDLGLEQTDSGFKDKVSGLDVSIKLLGQRKIGYWGIVWNGEKEAVLSFSKRLINVLKMEYSDLQGENNYYACRFQSGNAQVILELTIWDDRIELINR